MGRMRVALWVKKLKTEVHTSTAAPRVEFGSWSHTSAVEPEEIMASSVQSFKTEKLT